MRNARILIALLVALAAGCARSGGRWGTPGEVRIGYLGTIYTLDPLIAFGQRLIDLTQLYTQPLVGIGPDSRAIPILCTAIPSVRNGGISRDGLTITYHLRHVRFADGVPLTSRDVAFTYHAILDPRNPITEADPYRRIAALETPDPYTVRIHLKAPWSGAIYELFAASDYVFGILPAHAFANDTELAHAVAWNAKPFGTGPFVVTQWNRGDSVVFDPNPYAWQKPNLHRIIVKMIADENTAYIDLLAHNIDFTDITYDQIAQAKNEPSIALVPIPRNNVDSIELQTEHLPDVDVRKAIAYAIDRAAIAKTIYHGESALATTEIRRSFRNTTRRSNRFPMIRRAPVRCLRGVTSLHASRSTCRRIPTRASRRSSKRISARSASMQRLTVRRRACSTRRRPRAACSTTASSIWRSAAGTAGSTPKRRSRGCANRAPHGPNVARWCDAQYDAAFAAQQRILDPAARTKQFWIMQQRIAAELPVIVLVERTEFEAVNPALRGFAPNMLYNFGQTEDWSLP